MHNERRTELLQMLGVTIIGSHSLVGSHALGEVRHHLVFLCGSSSHGLQGNFQLTSRLRLRLEFMYFSSMAPTCDGPGGSNLEGHSVFSMNPFAFSEFCMKFEHCEIGVLCVETA